MASEPGGQKKPGKKIQETHLTDVANHTLTFFEDTAEAARRGLERSQDKSAMQGAGMPVAVNAVASIRAAHKLATIGSENAHELAKLTNEPAIARVVVKGEDGKEQTFFITRGTTLAGSIDGARMAHYRSPMGRLAALRVGHDGDIQTPQGLRNYELREKAELRPNLKKDGWDSVDTRFHARGSKALTIRSLRQLRGEEAADGADYLDSLLAEGRAAENVLEGLQRDVRKKMGLRDQPLLDEIQDDIFRMPLSSRLIVLGPPGTGKTTTLIKRLGLKLDDEHLEEEEKVLITRTAAGPDQHRQSWMMFTPTELLKQYVKEAFAREDIAASDERIKTWADFSRDIARNKLGILRTETNNGSFVFRPTMDPFQRPTMDRQTKWFEDFENWQGEEFWKELAAHANRLAADNEQNVAQLGTRLKSVIASSSGPADKFIAIASTGEELQKLAAALGTVTDDKIRSGLGQLFRQQPNMIARLMDFVATLEDAAEESDDPETEEEEDHRRPADRAAAIDACIRALRSQARAAASGRTLGKATRHGRLVDFLGENVLPAEELKSIGTNLQIQTAARRLASPLARFISGIPRRYRRFRRERQTEGRYYTARGFAAADISPIETDAVLLAMFRATRVLLRDIRISRDIDQPSHASLQAVQSLFRTQIVVDEATDFSPIQLACMMGICDPVANSFFACGDFNQRITTWGTKNLDEMKWAIPSPTVREINISYRHSEELNELAHRIALVSNPSAMKTMLPEDVINRGFRPVAAYGLSQNGATAEWLAARIGEIERLTGTMPSIAVLVNDEDQVDPVAKALDAELTNRSLRAVACLQGQTVGQDNDVRVFDVRHIKGLEFEAVFFVGIDELSRRMPDLFDKYLYVGATRAATFLGLTTQGPALPESIQSLSDLFERGWSS